MNKLEEAINDLKNYYLTTENITLSIQALQEKFERENPKPLEIKQFLYGGDRIYSEVYIKNLNTNNKIQHVKSGGLTSSGNIRFYKFGESIPITRKVDTYGITWLAYDYEPTID